MNNPSNENQNPLSDAVQPADTPAAESSAEIAEADQPLIQFLENTEPNKEPSEDPFFAPLPELPENVDDEEDAGEPESSESIGEDSDRSDAADDETTEPTAEHTDDISDHHSEPPSDTPANRKKIGKILGIIAGSILGLVLAVFGIFCAILFRLSTPITVDLDETVSLGALESNPVLSFLTEAEPGPAAIDTSAIGEKEIQLTFFGFLPRTVPVSVRDLTLPRVTVYRMPVGIDSVPNPDDCVLLCEDKTAVTHTFAESPNTSVPGDTVWLLLSTDPRGNTIQPK